MLYRYSLHNRWVKAALTTSELLALLTNGLWDVSDPDCKAVQVRSSGGHTGRHSGPGLAKAGSLPRIISSL